MTTPFTPASLVAKWPRSTFALEERTLQFAANVRAFAKRLPRGMASDVDTQQLLRAAGALAVSYIKANEAPNKTDFTALIQRCLSQAKESTFWLRLIDAGPSDSPTKSKDALVNESRELMRIFFAILRKLRKSA